MRDDDACRLAIYDCQLVPLQAPSCCFKSAIGNQNSEMLASVMTHHYFSYAASGTMQSIGHISTHFDSSK